MKHSHHLIKKFVVREKKSSVTLNEKEFTAVARLNGETVKNELFLLPGKICFKLSMHSLTCITKFGSCRGTYSLDFREAEKGHCNIKRCLLECLVVVGEGLVSRSAMEN